jgi:hypothetical protein
MVVHHRIAAVPERLTCVPIRHCRRDALLGSVFVSIPYVIGGWGGKPPGRPFMEGHSAKARKKIIRMLTRGTIIKTASGPGKPAFVKIFQKGSTMIRPTMISHKKTNIMDLLFPWVLSRPVRHLTR